MFCRTCTEVPLDPQRPEDEAQRKIHRLEHGPLLDVHSTLAGGGPEPAARPPACRPGRRRARAPHPGARCRRCPRPRRSSDPLIEPAAAGAPNSSARSAPLLVGPVDKADGDRWLAFVSERRSTSAPAVTSGSRRASRRSARSRGGRRSAAPCPSAAQREPLVPGRVDPLLGRQPASLPRSHSRARSQVSVQATRWAPLSSPSAPAARASSATVRAGWSGTRPSYGVFAAPYGDARTRESRVIQDAGSVRNWSNMGASLRFEAPR